MSLVEVTTIGCEYVFDVAKSNSIDSKEQARFIGI